jgi:hypothetical protein
MSRQEKRESPPADPTPAPPAEKAPANEAEGAAAPKPKYVFKIVPADPKNAFDFEDVADK